MNNQKKMKNVLICIILLLTTACSVKWANKVADKGFHKEGKEAMKLYNLGILLNKRSYKLYWGRACLHADNGNHQKAMKDLEKYLKLNSESDSCFGYWCRAVFKSDAGDLLGALSDFDKAILINPENQICYFFRGTLKYTMKDFKGALSDFDSAIKFWDNYYMARHWRSRLRVELNDFEGAMEDYNHLQFSKDDEFDYKMAQEFRCRGIAKYNTKDTIGACYDWKIAAKHKDSIALIRLREHCN